MNSNEWVPSHVQVTVNQARELLLKNKNSSSEVFVIVNTDKEKFVTTSVPKSAYPVWNFTNEIPLMSLDTTLHLTVRQTGRFSDEFIGYIAIPLSGFKLSSKQVTHWYKLGSRPGKQNHKLRGDLLVTIQLLFNWVQEFSDTSATPSSKKIYPVSGKRVGLARSKSDLKIKPEERSSSLPSDTEAESTTTHSGPKVKEKMSVFRRSFRKKNRSPIFKECVDDFTSFSPPTPRARSNTIDITSQPPQLSKNSPGASLSDVSTSGSEGNHTPLKPSVLALFAEAAVLEEEEKQEQGRSEEKTKDETKEEVDVKLSPASRYRSFRSTKKRWSMHTLPLTTPSPAHTPTDYALTPDNLEEETYVARPAHSPMISRTKTQSLYMDNQLSNSSLTTQPAYTSAGSVNTVRDSPEEQVKREPESGYNTSSSLHKTKRKNDEGKEATKREERKTPKHLSAGRKSPVSKPDSPVSKRTVTSPTSRARQRSQSRTGAVSPSSNRQRSGVASTSSGTNSLKRERKPRSVSNARPISSVVSPNRSPALPRKASDSSKPVTKVTRSVSLREQSSSKRRPRSMIESSKPREKPVRPTIEVSNEGKAKLGAVTAVSSGEVATDSIVDTSSSSVEGANAAVNSDPSTDSAESAVHSGTPSEKSVESAVNVNVPTTDAVHTASPSVDAVVSSKEDAETVSDISKDSHTVAQTDHSPEDVKSSDESLQVSPERNHPVEAVKELDTQESPGGKEQSDPEPNSESSSPNDETVSIKSDTSSIASSSDDRRPKHTVAYCEKSPLFKDGFQPVSLLPPSFMTYQSQTLPSRGKLARHSSDTNFTITQRPSTLSGSQETLALQRKSVTLRQANETPENVRVLHRKSINLSMLSSYHQDTLNSIPQSPPREINSLEDLNRDESLSRLSTTSTISQGSESRPSTPATPTSIRYGGKTPGEIVTSALRSRKPSGGLRNAITRYQESQKQRREGQKVPLRETSSLQVEEECLDRSTSSAETSPSMLRRNRSSASTFTSAVRNTFSLRRTKSQSHAHSSNGRPDSISDVDCDSLSDLQSPALSVPANFLSSINHSESVEQLSPVNSLQEEDSRTLVEASIKSDVSARMAREDTPTLTESASVKTLTESECQSLSVRRTSSPNPAGAVTGTHIRHTTCSSIGSEGIGSYTSEEMSLDDLTHQDCSQWSKEDLVKELIHSKQRLKNTEDELKDVKTYLDNLLLRIMETNPSILSSIRSS